ncbi:MAG: YeeE/YedE thiosulfate transporter family protein [Fibrobacterales bacterium]
MAPIEILSALSELQLYIVHLLIGIGFGFTLEQAGFGDSRLLAAQFYFKNLTVLKVMFTAIITCMVGIFLASSLGVLDYTQIWVNPTYLWPGIVGGLIMGVGFVLGGYCPGTSLVSMSTLKIDGALFVVGGLIGMTIFGETIDEVSIAWSSSYMGRLTLPQVFNLPTGVMVLLAVAMAVGMFKGGEWLENKFGDGSPKARFPKWAMGGFLAVIIAIIVIGQPTPERRWEFVKETYQPKIDSRAVFIHPGELVKTWFDDKLSLSIWDFRSEDKFNLINIIDSDRKIATDLTEKYIIELRKNPPNRVTVIVGESEQQALSFYKQLMGYGIPNIYILDGGIEQWLRTFKTYHTFTESVSPSPYGLHFDIPEAKGARHSVSEPEKEWIEHLQYPSKIKLELKRGVAGGGCG